MLIENDGAERKLLLFDWHQNNLSMRWLKDFMQSNFILTALSKEKNTQQDNKIQMQKVHCYQQFINAKI